MPAIQASILLFRNNRPYLTNQNRVFNKAV